jgi:hypothetical protein
MKSIYKSSTANITAMKKLKTFSLRLEIEEGFLHLPQFFSIVLDVLANAARLEK